MLTVAQAFALALQHHQTGRLAEAEALYRQILAVQPNHADALHLMGVIAHRVGRHDLAVDLINQAIQIDPNNAAAHFHLGESYRAAGRTPDAVAAYRRSIQLNPCWLEAHNNLGIALAGQGHFEEAITAFRGALEYFPDAAVLHFNLGNALKCVQRREEAMAAYRDAIRCDPNHPEAHNNLGILLAQQGRLKEALAEYQCALRLKPANPEVLNNLGNVLRSREEFREAEVFYRRALELKTDYVEAHKNLGVTLAMQGRSDEAVEEHRRALELKPGDAECHNNLGNLLADQCRLEEAIAEYRVAIDCQPHYPEAHSNLSIVLAGLGRTEEGIAAARYALQCQPKSPEMHSNLGNLLKDSGALDESIAAYRRALATAPDNAVVWSNLIYTLHFLPGLDHESIGVEQSKWNRRFSEPVQRFVLSHVNHRSPESQLRIGYVSADFREHVVGRNLLPLFRHHDLTACEIICYSSVGRPDRVTEEFQHHAGRWRNATGLSDAALADMIRRDEVDILVDLTQHMSGNRLPIFAHQPAPVQVSFAGYPESAGVEAIEYRISDRWLECDASRRDAWIVAGGRASSASDTPGMDAPQRDRTPAGVPEGSPAPAGADTVMTGQPEVVPPATVQQPSGLHPAERVFLLDSFWCYDPCGVEVDINELPAESSGFITFGCLNNFCKVNDPLLKLWAQVLKQVPHSRLVMLSGFGSHRQRTSDFLASEGVVPQRVEFVAPQPRKEYLELYHRLDMVLDTFPYNGHTTSLDALWMGVPVVSLAGERPVSRAGWSQLANLGLPELVAHSETAYVELATRLASDRPRLEDLRRTLRSRMEGSVLMDAPRFARNLEAAYRAMWRRWCAQAPR